MGRKSKLMLQGEKVIWKKIIVCCQAAISFSAHLTEKKRKKRNPVLNLTTSKITN